MNRMLMKGGQNWEEIIFFFEPVIIILNKLKAMDGSLRNTSAKDTGINLGYIENKSKKYTPLNLSVHLQHLHHPVFEHIVDRIRKQQNTQQKPLHGFQTCVPEPPAVFLAGLQTSSTNLRD